MYGNASCTETVRCLHTHLHHRLRQRVKPRLQQELDAEYAQVGRQREAAGTAVAAEVGDGPDGRVEGLCGSQKEAEHGRDHVPAQLVRHAQREAEGSCQYGGAQGGAPCHVKADAPRDGEEELGRRATGEWMAGGKAGAVMGSFVHKRALDTDANPWKAHKATKGMPIPRAMSLRQQP